MATIYFDGGGQRPGPVRAAAIVELSDGSLVQAVRRFDTGTHNFAEWNALILGLRLALDHGERHAVVKGDSRLVVDQVNGDAKAKHPTMLRLREEAEELLAQFDDRPPVDWIPREENGRADELGRGVMSFGPVVSIGGD